MKRPAPRYEFRVFASEFGLVADSLSRWGSGEQESLSAELYVVSRRGERHNVKIRDRRLEIKRLVERTGQLELWQPILRRAFPLTRRVLRERISPALDVTFERLPEPAYDLWPFVHQVLVPRHDLAVVRVSKHRCQFALGECLAEIVHLQINGERVQSIAVESATPEPVRRLLRELGLDQFENSSYPAILKQILDFDHDVTGRPS